MSMLKIKSERMRRGWSQQALGFRASVQGADICKMEKGRLIPYEGQAQRIAAVLEIKPEELLQPVE